jgi:CRISP-associated protein Cas1
MIKKTIEISGYDTVITLKNKQVAFERNGEKLGQIPAEDIAVLIIDAPDATYTHSTLLELVNNGAVIVLCGKKHNPDGIIIPCVANTLQSERLSSQVNLNLPVKKRLWQQLIRTKIKNQAANLPEESRERKKMMSYAERVKSGDPDNIEGQAAKFYWKHWLGNEHKFKRERFGESPNNFLNYGYMVIRASVARAIVGAGFHPSIGLKHHNRYNPFCLADDLIEPFRPLVDCIARNLFLSGETELNKETKTELLKILSQKVKISGNIGPFMVELERMMASLEKCFTDKIKKLQIPKIK